MYIAAILCFVMVSYQVFDDSKQRVIVMTFTRSLTAFFLAYISYITNMFVATAIFFTILQQENVNDLLCNFAGLLVVIQIDDMIGSWAVEYMIKDSNKGDEDFLVIRMTDMEYKFAEKICLLLMLCYAVWCSLFYKLLSNYQEGNTQILYFVLTYFGFFLWPVVQLFFKLFCSCCIRICFNSDNSLDGKIERHAG